APTMSGAVSDLTHGCNRGTTISTIGRPPARRVSRKPTAKKLHRATGESEGPPPGWDRWGCVTATPRGCEMKQRYESPRLVVYGRIAESNFQTPGGPKGSTTD